MKIIVQQENHDIVVTTGTRWDNLLDGTASADGYRLFRRDKQGKRGGGAALYVRERIDCLELSVVREKVERLWVKIRRRPTKQITW